MAGSKKRAVAIALAVVTSVGVIGACDPYVAQGPPITIVGSDVAACQAERADLRAAHEAAHVVQQSGGSPKLREFLTLPTVYFQIEDGLVTKPIGREPATLKRVPASRCTPISNDEVPIGWP